MTEYSDIPQVNALYQESETLSTAIAMIDSGSTVLSFSVGQPRMEIPPSTKDDRDGTSREGADMVGNTWPVLTALPIVVMPVLISIPGGSTDPQLVIDARAACVTRQLAIEVELNSLGVVSTRSVLSAARSVVTAVRRVADA